MSSHIYLTRRHVKSSGSASCFTNGETKAQKGQQTCPRSQTSKRRNLRSSQVCEPGSWPSPAAHSRCPVLRLSPMAHSRHPLSWPSPVAQSLSPLLRPTVTAQSCCPVLRLHPAAQSHSPLLPPSPTAQSHGPVSLSSLAAHSCGPAFPGSGSGGAAWGMARREGGRADSRGAQPSDPLCPSGDPTAVSWGEAAGLNPENQPGSR